MSIDTANSKEIMVGTHITEQHSLEYQESVQLELLNMAPYEPHTCDLPQNYQLDFLNNFMDLNILSKTDDVTNNVTNTPAVNVLNQKIQDYYNRQDQQYSACTYNGGREQVTLELVPNNILEKEENSFY